MDPKESLPAIVVKNTYTLSALYKRLDLLQRFLEHYFFGGRKEGAPVPQGDRVELLKEFYRDADADLRYHVDAVTAWERSVIDSFTAQNLYERIQGLKEKAKGLPTLTLYVPMHLSSVQLEPIGVWCRAHVEKDIVLDVRIDPASVGGCELAYNNTFHDLSFSYFVAKERPALTKFVHDYNA
jgi:hypothetical protein